MLLQYLSISALLQFLLGISLYFNGLAMNICNKYFLFKNTERLSFCKQNLTKKKILLDMKPNKSELISTNNISSAEWRIVKLMTMKNVLK